MTISAPGTSALATLAASMPAGSWAQLEVSNQNAILGVGNQSGSMIHYCNSMPWNPIRKGIEIIAMDHGTGTQRYMRYDAASLGLALGPAFKLIHTSRHEHATPWDSRQVFQFSVFRREG